jgi:hypothetical protein
MKSLKGPGSFGPRAHKHYPGTKAWQEEAVVCWDNLQRLGFKN